MVSKGWVLRHSSKHYNHLNSVAVPTPNSQSFAEALLQVLPESIAEKHTLTTICNELDRVSKWFSKDGQYYDKDSNVVSISGAILFKSNVQTKQHSIGDINPKNKARWSDDEVSAIDNIHTHNLLHNSSTDRSNVQQHSLPEGVSDINGCMVKINCRALS